MDFLGLLFVFLLATMVGSFVDVLSTRRYVDSWATVIAGGMFGASLLNALAGRGDATVGGVHIFWALIGALLGVTGVEVAVYFASQRRKI